MPRGSGRKMLRIVCVPVPVHTIRRFKLCMFPAVDDQSIMLARVMGPVTSPSDLRGGRVRTLPRTRQVSFSSLENNSVGSNAVTSEFDVDAPMDWVANPAPGDQCAASDIWTASLTRLDVEKTCTDTDDGAASQTRQLQEGGDLSPGHALQLARGCRVLFQLFLAAGHARCLVRGMMQRLEPFNMVRHHTSQQ